MIHGSICTAWRMKLYSYTANAPQQSRSACPEGKKLRYIKKNLHMVVLLFKRIANFYELFRSVVSEPDSDRRSLVIKGLLQIAFKIFFIRRRQRYLRMGEKSKCRGKHPCLSHVFDLDPAFFS